MRHSLVTKTKKKYIKINSWVVNGRTLVLLFSPTTFLLVLSNTSPCWNYNAIPLSFEMFGEKALNWIQTLLSICRLHTLLPHTLFHHIDCKQPIKGGGENFWVASMCFRWTFHNNPLLWSQSDNTHTSTDSSILYQLTTTPIPPLPPPYFSDFCYNSLKVILGRRENRKEEGKKKNERLRKKGFFFVSFNLFG